MTDGVPDASWQVLRFCATADRREWPMAFHKRTLEWQAAHPNLTWLGWGIVWAVVLSLQLWPRATH